MRTRKLTGIISVVAVIGLLASTAAPALAAPVPSSTASLHSAIASPVTQVRWRGHRGGGVAAGVLGGLLLGGIIASQAGAGYYGPGPGYYGPGPGYYGPPPGYGPGDWMAYCSSRYRSFDPASGTYMGYDGYRHPCR